jgi:hypothetical protein
LLWNGRRQNLDRYQNGRAIFQPQSRRSRQAWRRVLVTCCPYCIDAFEESRLGLNYEDTIEVKDITEIIQEVI